MENSHYMKESGNQYHRDFSRIRILGFIMRLIVRLQSETAGSGIQGPPDPLTAGGVAACGHSRFFREAHASQSQRLLTGFRV